MTGNSRYLAEVLKVILPKHKNKEFFLYTNKPIHPVFQNLLGPNTKVVLEPKNIPGPIYLNFILPKRLKQDGIEVFWGTIQMLPFLKLPIPSYVNYHDLNFISAPETMAKWNYWQHKFLSPITMKNADKIFCLSKNTKEEISAFRPEFKKKCLVVYPGVIKQKTAKTKTKFPKDFFLTVGTLEPRKNINCLVDAFLDFKRKYPKDKHSLLIMGRKGWGEEGDFLYQKLNDAKIQTQGIQFIEKPDDATLSEAFKQCKAFFFPSLHEGFGLPLLEAMLEDKRCVASDIPVFKEILSNKCDLFVPPKETKTWTHSFELMSGPKKTRSPKFPANQWTWEETAKKIEEVLFQ
ncbi:glycosyltransferase family 4 protein [Leptospira sp. 201903074]|uniref:glycosyltransferase family 4 protein n=1 Tax=Leptospira abararensis TaxID=2810036 RepID=UPI00196266B0|nr:glycosyltransferase family 1 protein [Leptospira abararensis]MBM9547546.1 glycosyltransferase family 4 protein [Leptospira abararensis]